MRGNIEYYDLGRFMKPVEIKSIHLNSLTNLDLDIEFDIAREETMNILKRLFELGVSYLWNGSIHRIDDYSFLLNGIDGVEVLGVIERCGDIYLPDAQVYSMPSLRMNSYLIEYKWINKIMNKKAYKIPVIGSYSFTTRLSLARVVRKKIRMMPIRRIAYLDAKLEYTSRLSKLVNRMLKDLIDEDGKIVFQINEPFNDILNYEDHIWIEGLKEIVKNIENKIIIYIGYAPLEKFLNIIEELNFKSLIVPLTHLEDAEIVRLIRLLNEYGVGLTYGVINAYDERVEEFNEVERIVDLIIRNHKGNYLAFSPDAPLDRIERDIALKKLYILSDAVKKFK